MGGGRGGAAYIIEHHLQHLPRGANALNVELLADQMYASGNTPAAREALAAIVVDGLR